MPKYNVHIYPILRVRYQGIEAGSPAEAIKIADEIFQQSEPCFRAEAFGDKADEAEYASEMDGYAVDPLNEHGEVIYEESESYRPDGVTPCRSQVEGIHNEEL